MANALGRKAAFVFCVLLLGWSMPPAYGSEAKAPDPQGPVVSEPTESVSYSPVPSPFSLTISPTRLTLGPGDIGKASKVLVVNRGEDPMSVTVEKENFTGGLDGSLQFQKNSPFSASDWVTVAPASFTVNPGSTQVVTATVKMPSGPEPGDHQVAIVFLVPAGRTPGNIKINRGVGAPVYITVPGPTSQTTLLRDFTAPGFVMSGPVTITATVQDVGTVHRDFRSKTGLTIHTAGSTAVFPDFTVLRGSTRDISTTWDPPLICVCHPSVSFTNADGSIQSATVRVIVFPLYQLGIVLVVLALVVLGALWWRRRYRANVASAAAKLPRSTDGGDDV